MLYEAGRRGHHGGPVEWHFLVRHDGGVLSGRLSDPGTAGHRWWSLDELETDPEQYYPANIAALVRHALRPDGALDVIEDCWDQVATWPSLMKRLRL